MPAPHAESDVRNALTIDVEDWYHDATGRPQPASPEEIASIGPRVAHNLETLLEILATHDTRATLFFLADVARAHPDLVRRAAALGHEIACHGLAHLRVADRTRSAFGHDVAEARAIVEDVLGQPVLGFRAPYFLQTDDLWALDVLAEAGFRYDSSYLPLHYMPAEPLCLGGDGGPVHLPSGLWEFPLPLSRLPTGHVLPTAAGGFALRALPFAVLRHYLGRFNAAVGPTVVYTHPWEIDPDSPKLPGTPRYVRFFNGVGRAGMTKKIPLLLRSFSFAPIAEIFADELDR